MGVHQGLALSPQVLVVVMEEAAQEERGSLWEPFYAADLLINTGSRENSNDRFRRLRFRREDSRLTWKKLR